MKRILLLFSLLLGVTYSSFSQNTYLYVAGSYNTSLYVYDTTGGPGSYTLADTRTLTSDFGGVSGCYGLSLDPSSGDMYILYQSTSGGSSARRLGLLDTLTGAIADIGNCGNMTDISFFGTELFATGGNSGGSYTFYRLNKADGSTTSLFPHPTAGYGHSIWWDSYNDRLYKTTQQIGTYSEIDTVTMTETTLSSGSHPGWSSGTIMINDSIAISCSGGGSLRTVNVNTWAWSTVGSLPEGHALAFGQYPLYIIVNGPMVFCDNENVTELAASESGTYQWFLDGTPISGETDSTHIPLATGLYTVEVDGKMTNPVMITVHPAPTASFDATPNPVDLGVTTSGTVDFTNTSIEGNEYLWNFDTGIETTTENPTYPFNTVGDYDVTLIVTIDSTGCSDTAVVTITVINSTGISELSADFSVYPVPTEDIVYVNMTNSSGAYTLELRDLNGRLVKVNELSPSNTTTSFDLGEMESGVYLLKVFNEKEQGHFKLIKK